MAICKTLCSCFTLLVVLAPLYPAAATRAGHWQEQHPYSIGRLLQQDALSNSNGCLSTIQKCEPGACATRNVKGTARWVCLRCLANYDPVVDDSGQDNILQCVCPKGFFEAASNATSCTRCPANVYCPGGDKVENPASRGSMVQCGSSMVTRSTGARSATDCVAPAGFALVAPTAAIACDRSEYAPQFNRLKKCIKCQGGLEEPIASNLTDGQRSSKRAVCRVPPGRYVSQGLVRICPQGFYRENYVMFDAAIAQKCVACNPGITTAGAGAKLASECNRVLPGYGVDNVYNVTGPSSIPALPQNSNDGLPEASVCELGFYSSSGFCAQCPAGTVTRVKGAKSIEECAVPPGYFLSSGSMAQCDTGFFREGWVMYSDPKATACTACGDNILSEPRDLDENPLAANGSLVRATSTSCFIEAGQGMIAQGRNVFRGTDCPENTYGAAGKVYGWTAAPCKPCPRNMITDGLIKVNNSEVCINPDGFGYASEGASRCAPGFYAAKGSRKACKRCPDGRTTEDDPSKQRYIGDCDVAPGYGVAGGNVASGDVFGADLSGLSEQQILDLTVLQCPTGYYGGGDSLTATCIKCPEGSTTKDPGSISVGQCDVCIPGRGKVSSSAPCTPCDYGFWQPGGLAECMACPNSTFYPPIDGIGVAYTSIATTFSTGATGVDWCVPMQSQLSPEAGQAYFNAALTPGTLNTLFEEPAASLEACLAICPYDMCCMAQYDTEAGTCKYAHLPPASPTETGAQLFYKLPAAGLTSASSIRAGNQSAAAAPVPVARANSWGMSSKAPRVLNGTKITITVRRQQAASGSVSAQSAKAGPAVRAKTLGSGSYARCVIQPSQAPAWAQVGTTLGLDARTFARGAATWLDVTDIVACQELCDNSNVCWGGIYDNGRCLFRGGEDALHTRSFFNLPDPRVAPGFVMPSMFAYYFTFANTDGSAFPSVTNDQLTLFQMSVQAALPSLIPFEEATVDVWVQVGNSTGVEIGLAFWDMSGNAVDVDLSSVFARNASTTTLIAKSLVEVIMEQQDVLNDGQSAGRIAAGLSIASSDGAQNPLEAAITIDGCTLVPNYCGANAKEPLECTMNVCTCKDGWTGYTCTKESA